MSPIRRHRCFTYRCPWKSRNGPNALSIAIKVGQWVIVNITVPVPTFTNRVSSQEPARAWIVVAVAQQLKPAVAIFLVALSADEPEGALRRSRASYQRTKRVVGSGRGNRLRRVGLLGRTP